MVKINVYRSNLGVFLSVDSLYSRASLYINGKLYTEYDRIGSGNTIRVDSTEKITVERMGMPGREVIGYELKIPGLANRKIPAYIKAKDIQTIWDDESESHVWTGKFAGLEAMYDEHIQTTPASLVPIEFELIERGTWDIDKLFTGNPSINLVANNNRKIEVNLLEVVTFDELASLIVPGFLLPNTECELSGDTLYKIIRHRIRSDINGAHARLTSDYDFCVTVKRRVAAAGFTNTILEMTPPAHRYKGYSVINGIKAPNFESLVKYLGEYLDNMMLHINKNGEACQHCKGMGVTNATVFPLPSSISK